MSSDHQTIYRTAKVFVMNREGKVLVLRRSKTDKHRPLTWDLPGGAIDFQESPLETAVREAREEASIELQSITLLAVLTVTAPAYIITNLFRATTESDNIQLSYEHDAYQWVTVAEFLYLDIPEKYKAAITAFNHLNTQAQSDEAAHG